MILSGNSIIDNVENQNIEIQPFDKSKVKSNSYTVTLGNELLVYTDNVIDTAKKNQTEKITIPKEGFVLKKNHFYIGYTYQYIGSDSFVPILHAIANTAKRGLFVHITANLIDIGNHCNFSLHLYPTENIKIYPGMDIAQVSFWKTDGNISLYNGKYKGVKGPVPSQSYRDAGK